VQISIAMYKMLFNIVQAFILRYVLFFSDNFWSNVFRKNYRIDPTIETLPDSKIQVPYHEICE